jgi:hypothetical protein
MTTSSIEKTAKALAIRPVKVVRCSLVVQLNGVSELSGVVLCLLAYSLMILVGTATDIVQSLGSVGLNLTECFDDSPLTASSSASKRLFCEKLAYTQYGCRRGSF